MIASLLALVLSAPPPPPTAAAGAALVEEYAGPRFFEGPVWEPTTGKLYFTAFGRGKGGFAADSTQILRLDGRGKAAVFADKTEGVNGTFLARDGRLLGAQAFGHRVVAYAPATGRAETLLHDPKLNQPNDLVEAANGDVYLTDPDFAERKRSAVYLLRKGGGLVRVIDDMPLPNGVKLSPDGKTLYVSDSHERHWRAYPVRPDGTCGPGRVFFDPITPDRREPDGLCLDEHGNLYLTGRGGVWCVSPGGKQLGFVPVPEFVSNACFGGADGRTLYLTCEGKVYSLAMAVRGLR